MLRSSGDTCNWLTDSTGGADVQMCTHIATSILTSDIYGDVGRTLPALSGSVRSALTAETLEFFNAERREQWRRFVRAAHRSSYTRLKLSLGGAANATRL